MEQEYISPEDSVADYEDAVLIGKSHEWRMGYYEGKQAGLSRAQEILKELKETIL